MNYSLRLVVLVLFLFLIPSCTQDKQETAAAYAPAISTAPASVESVIAKLENDWVNAIVKKDLVALDRVLADDFIGATSDGEMYEKDEAIADAKTGTHESIVLDGINVRVFGNTAVATMGQTEKSHHTNKDYSGRYVFTDVWVNRDGQWRAVASHGSQAK